VTRERVATSRRRRARRTLLWMGLGFAAGCIPSGRLVTRAVAGQELDDIGDGKPGSANVARSVGWKAGAAVLAMDAGKAYAPACAARLAGAANGTVAAIGISAMVGHIAVVKGRGAACALGASFAMDPAMMGLGCVPLVGGSVLHKHAQAVTVTALSLPVISFALHRSMRRAAGPFVLISILMAARLRGSAGAGLPRTPAVWRNRFWLDRDQAAVAPAGGGRARAATGGAGRARRACQPVLVDRAGRREPSRGAPCCRARGTWPSDLDHRAGGRSLH
jgi:glycerol-3-phosphate acyltransferase PlsY